MASSYGTMDRATYAQTPLSFGQPGGSDGSDPAQKALPRLALPGRSRTAALFLLSLLLILAVVVRCINPAPGRWSGDLRPTPDAGLTESQDQPSRRWSPGSAVVSVPRFGAHVVHRAVVVAGQAIAIPARAVNTIVQRVALIATRTGILLTECAREFVVAVVGTAADITKDLMGLISETTGIVLRAVLEAWTEVLTGFAKVVQLLATGAVKATEDVASTVHQALSTALGSSYASGETLTRATVPAARAFVRSGKQVALDTASRAVRAAEGILAAVDKQLAAAAAAEAETETKPAARPHRRYPPSVDVSHVLNLGGAGGSE